MKNSKMQYAKNDKLTEDEFEKRNTKVRITTFIDIDLLERLKEEAAVTEKNIRHC